MADGGGGGVRVVEGEAVQAAPRRARQVVRPFSAKLARAVCQRVASGESMNSISRDPDMPGRSTLTVWARTIPTFGRRLARAKELGGWSEAGRPPPRSYCEMTAREVFARLCEGETLTSVCADPGMPGTSTIYRWRLDRPEFARQFALARRVQAERYCDRGWEIAEAVTPGDAYATHVKLTQLRWMAGVMAPEVFGRHRAVEADTRGQPEREDAEPGTLVITARHFRTEQREDGSARVIGYRREPGTNRLKREPGDPPWSPPNPRRAGQVKDAPEYLDG